MLDHPATSHPASWSQTRERAKPVSVVSWWVQPSKPTPLTHRTVRKVNDSCGKPLCFREVCYTAKASWYKFQKKGLRPPNKPHTPYPGSLGWSESIPVTSNHELTETLNAEPERQNQTEVPTLSPFPIWKLLPLCYTHSTLLTLKSTLFPVPPREKRSQEGADIFLVLDDTLMPHSTHLSLPCSSSHSHVPRIASLLCVCNFPTSLLPLFHGLSRRYKGWTTIQCFISELREGEKIKIKKEQRNEIFIFIKRGDIRSKLRKNDDRWGPLPFSHFRWGNRGSEEPDNLSTVTWQIQDSNPGLSDPRAISNHGMKCSRMMKMPWSDTAQ